MFFTGLNGITDNTYYYTGSLARQCIATMSWIRNLVSSLFARTDHTQETSSPFLNTVEYDCGCDYFYCFIVFSHVQGRLGRRLGQELAVG